MEDTDQESMDNHTRKLRIENTTLDGLVNSAEKGNWLTVKKILDGEQCGDKKSILLRHRDDIEENTIIHMATAQRNVSIVNYILAAVSSLSPIEIVSYKSDEGWTEFKVKDVRNTDTNLSRVTCSLLHIRNRVGNTAVHEAASSNSLNTFQCILETCNNMDEVHNLLDVNNGLGRNVLLTAYANQDITIVDYILTKLEADNLKIHHLMSGHATGSSVIQFLARHNETEFICDAFSQINLSSRPELLVESITMPVLQAAFN